MGKDHIKATQAYLLLVVAAAYRSTSAVWTVNPAQTVEFQPKSWLFLDSFRFAHFFLRFFPNPYRAPCGGAPLAIERIIRNMLSFPVAGEEMIPDGARNENNEPI